MNRELLSTFGLDPEVLHLNHGAFGCAPIPVRRAAEVWRDRAERNPHRFNADELPPLIAETRQRAASFLGISPESAGLVRNVSEGVSAVLGSLDLGAGDEILLSSHGYGAVRIAATSWAERRGASVVSTDFAVGADDEDIVAAFVERCSPRTRLVVVDQITSGTAMVLPVARIAAAVDAPVLVDAAHVPGTLRTDIAGLGVAYWVGNLHKWGYTPRGSAVLWTREDLRAVTFPAVLSWQLPDGYAAAFDHPGTGDYAGWLAIGDGLDFWERLGGWDQIARQATMITDAQHRLAEAIDADLKDLATVPAPTMRLLPLPDLPDESADRLSGLLAERHRITVPTTGHGGRRFLRMAAAPYNTPDDYDRLGEALLDVIGG
ncbi:aminotransferase class V-fold PLP-dependent enzyme [Microlunatus soli]|uniref:Isopenicillin-N epimerase n=1 Tax=Microlunatus soli TaxID=630515 RepID=A0A1H1ZPV0_9ACTN|nr:aminotransferase class V-fold PLP-dependent enzyme [Microlunatus soli]SDT35276.1 isopenicillin-N epimerase [Microlunatus soli]